MKRTDTQRGISLIETLVSVSIFVVLIGVVVGTIIYFYRVNNYSIEQSFAVASGRSGVEDLVRDLREASYADTGAYPLEEIAPHAIVFYSDIDKDQSVERVRYTLVASTTLVRESTESSGVPISYPDTPTDTETISENVRNLDEGVPIFTYVDSDGVEVSDMSRAGDVAFVQVSLIVNVNPIRLPNEFLIRSSAKLRNFASEI